jgi:hypothetical protein
MRFYYVSAAIDVPARGSPQVYPIPEFGGIDQPRSRQGPIEVIRRALRKATPDEAARHNPSRPDRKLPPCQHRSAIRFNESDKVFHRSPFPPFILIALGWLGQSGAGDVAARRRQAGHETLHERFVRDSIFPPTDACERPFERAGKGDASGLKGPARKETSR